MLLEFQITASGKADKISVLQADEGRLFTENAIRLIQHLVFAVEKGWEASGNSTHRFRVSVAFELEPCEQLPPYEGVDGQVRVCQAPILRFPPL